MRVLHIELPINILEEHFVPLEEGEETRALSQTSRKISAVGDPPIRDQEVDFKSSEEKSQWERAVHKFEGCELDGVLAGVRSVAGLKSNVHEVDEMDVVKLYISDRHVHHGLIADLEKFRDSANEKALE